MSTEFNRRLLIVVATHATTVAAQILLHPLLGQAAAGLGLVAVLTGAICFGLRGGLASATVHLGLTSAVMNWVVYPPVVFNAMALFGTALWFMLGAAVGNQRDLSRKLRAELNRNEQLRVRERETLEAITDVMIRVAPDSTCRTEPNDEPIRLEQTLERVLGAPLPAGQMESLTAGIERAHRSNTPQTGSLNVADGVSYDVRCFPTADDSVLVVLRDVTEQQKLQRRIVSTENLASLGTLAAGLAHEINNPLTYVITSIRAIGESPVSTDPNVAAEVDAALEGAWRIRDLVRGLLEATNDQDEAVEPVSIVEVVDTALTLVDGQVRHRATVTFECDGTPLALGHRAKLIQVLVNLVVNASQAFEGDHRESNAIVVHSHGTDSHVVVEVSDNGPGMDEATQVRAIEPFYTTRDPGQGSGLGLFLCNSIVESLGGKLEIASRPRQGTTVTLRLPIAGEPASRTVARRQGEFETATRALPRCRVLIIDDEPEIRRALRRQLGRGHAVSMSTNGAEALQRFTMGERFDVVLCDLLMPEMTGMELLDELQRQFPDQAARMVFITGGATSEATRSFVQAHLERVVTKPFTPEMIETAMRSVLRFSSLPPPARQPMPSVG